MNIRRIIAGRIKKATKDFITQQVKESLLRGPAEKEIKALVATEIKKALTPKPKPAPDYGDNTVINHPVLENSKIVFKGTGNILYCDEGVKLTNSLMHFSGSNSLIYLSNGTDSRYSSVHMAIRNNSTIYIGSGTNFNFLVDFKAHLSVSECKNVIIGDDCMFSFNTWITTSDAHATFDINTKQRTNMPKSVLIGDHVWIGQNVTILKGAQIGSGSIIGANSLLTGKVSQSNAIYAGSPARLVRSGTFYSRPDIQLTDRVATQSNKSEALKASFSEAPLVNRLMLDQIDEGLARAKTSAEKLKYIKKTLVSNKNKNRFYINGEN